MWKKSLKTEKNGNLLSLFTPILRDEICPKNSWKSEYAHFQTINNFPVYLSAMGIRENYYPENLALNIGPVSFWDKYFFVRYIFFTQKK